MKKPTELNIPLVHCEQLEPVTPPNVHNTIILTAIPQSPSNHGTKKMSPGYGPRRGLKSTGYGPIRRSKSTGYGRGSKSTGYGPIRRSKVHQMYSQFNWREARL